MAADELIGQSITFIGQLMIISSCHKIPYKTMNSNPKEDGARQQIIYGGSKEMCVCVKLRFDCTIGMFLLLLLLVCFVFILSKVYI